tara:strand:- start:422 stop:1030 length:609 start_codon:yes stop_codon:yes gene_type:complete
VPSVPQLLDASIGGNNMGTPQGVWRHSLESTQSIQAGKNLLNLDTWPSWNSSAQRVLSSSTGLFSEGQRFDLHRIERQRLVEELWLVKSIRRGENPNFVEVEFEWLGQQREGKTIGTSLKSLQLTVTVLCEEEGGVEIAAWWQIPWWARPIRSRINAQAKSFATQWLEDLSSKGIDFIEDSQSFLFVENKSEHSKTVGDDEE